MNEGINLAETNSRVQKKRNPFIIASVVVAAALVVLPVFLFGYTLFLKSTQSRLIEQEGQEIQKLTVLSPEKTKILTIQERLSAVQRILNSRQNMSIKFNLVSALIPNGVQVTDIAASDEGMSVRIASESLELLNTFLEEKLPTVLKNKAIGIRKIDIQDFSFQRGTSGYTTGVNFTFVN